MRGFDSLMFEKRVESDERSWAVGLQGHRIHCTLNTTIVDFDVINEYMAGNSLSEYLQHSDDTLEEESSENEDIEFL